MAQNTAVTSYASAASTESPSSASGTSRYAWPLPGHPTPLRRFAVGAERWSPGHRGVDLPAQVGRPVLAAGQGRVTFSGVVAGRPVVVVAHGDGIRTTYQPVAGTLPVGTDVRRGGFGSTSHLGRSYFS